MRPLSRLSSARECARLTDARRARSPRRFEEEGSRIDDMKLIVERVALAASLFDDDGISVRFLNSK